MKQDQHKSPPGIATEDAEVQNRILGAVQAHQRHSRWIAGLALVAIDADGPSNVLAGPDEG